MEKTKIVQIKIKKAKYHDSFVMPVQRCIAGEDVKNLSDMDILAVIIGNGNAGADVFEVSSGILKSLGGLTGISRAGIRELARERGIGLRKAIRIHCACELGKRAILESASMTHVSSPEAVWKLLLPEVAGLLKEEFRVLILNNKNRVLRKTVVSIGTISEAIVHPREVFRDAIREGGSAVIICHNHPSGVTAPSKEDIAATARIAEAGKIIGIPLLDHVILTNTSFLSLKEEGYI